MQKPEEKNVNNYTQTIQKRNQMSISLSTKTSEQKSKSFKHNVQVSWEEHENMISGKGLLQDDRKARRNYASQNYDAKSRISRYFCNVY